MLQYCTVGLDFVFTTTFFYFTDVYPKHMNSHQTV